MKDKTCWQFRKIIILVPTLAVGLLSSCEPPREIGEGEQPTAGQGEADAAGDQRDVSTFERSLEQYRQVLFDRSKPLDRFLEDVRAHHRVPALAAAFTTLDGIQSKAAVGVKSYGRPEPVAIDDIFCIGSCSKSMTAMMIASMVEEGLLHWGTRPIDVFPELKDAIYPEFAGITIKQLLSHSAGVGLFVSDEDFFGVHSTIEGLTGPVGQQRKRFALWNLERGPASSAGSYAYSNGGYVIAAAMAEKAAGQSWESLMKKRVFEPLNLKTAFIGFPQEQNTANVRRHYDRDSTGDPIPLALDARPVTPLFHPAGIVSVSITDFARYALFNLRGLNGVSTTLKPETIDYMHRPVAETGDVGAYALGWNVIKADDVWISTHSGGDSSVYAVIGIDRRKKVAVVVLCNMGDARATAACANVMLELMP